MKLIDKIFRWMWKKLHDDIWDFTSETVSDNYGELDEKEFEEKFKGWFVE